MPKRAPYIVRPGDSLSKIALRQLGDMSRWTELAYMNSIAEPYILQIGQEIILPDDEPLEVVITKGQTEQAAPVLEAALNFNPATVALLVAGAALIFFWDDIFGQ